MNKIIMQKVLIIIAVAVALIANSCKDDGTGPENLEPGRRDYVWTADTLNPGQESLYLMRIWGSSPTDVWAVGSSSWTATSIWHYNGTQWRCDSVQRAVNPSALYGTSDSEVWLGNTNSSIWRCNNNFWSKYGEYSVKNYDAVIIQDFNGITSNDIYGVGFKHVYENDTTAGIIMHYNGYNWGFISIPNIWVNFETVAVDNKTGILLISGTMYDPKGFIAKIYSWDGKEVKELLSGSGNTYITKLGSEIFATYNSKIYKYSDKKLTLWKDNTGTEINGNIICGRSMNDFFIGASSGIAHYNGTDFDIIYKNEPSHNIQIIIGKIFEKEVFFISNDFTIGKNMIIHGKLE
jgi:hypothetical protein